MNRFEVLRGINIFLMIPLSIISILGIIISLVTFNYMFAIATIIFITLTFGLKATLDPLTMRAHQEYFPKHARVVPINEWNSTHRVCIPKAELVTED